MILEYSREDLRGLPFIVGRFFEFKVVVQQDVGFHVDVFVPISSITKVILQLRLFSWILFPIIKLFILLESPKLNVIFVLSSRSWVELLLKRLSRKHWGLHKLYLRSKGALFNLVGSVIVRRVVGHFGRHRSLARLRQRRGVLLSRVHRRLGLQHPRFRRLESADPKVVLRFFSEFHIPGVLHEIQKHRR